MKKGGRATGTRGPDEKNIIKAEGRFTNMAIPKFNGGAWLLATASTNCSGYCEVEWVDGYGTAALQLFAHLDGEALNVALLMPVE